MKKTTSDKKYYSVFTNSVNQSRDVRSNTAISVIFLNSKRLRTFTAALLLLVLTVPCKPVWADSSIAILSEAEIERKVDQAIIRKGYGTDQFRLPKKVEKYLSEETKQKIYADKGAKLIPLVRQKLKNGYYLVNSINQQKLTASKPLY